MRWLALLVLLTASAAAQPTSQQVIRTGIDDVLAVLRDPKTSGPGMRTQRIANLRRVADRLFDWPEMSRRSLGPAWRTLDDTQRTRFSTLFPELLADAYLDDLDKFRGDEHVAVEHATEADNEAQVDTALTTHAGERVPMVYWLHRVDGEWRIYDFSIEGVSLVNNYRESFGRFLINHDFDALMKRLESKRAAKRGTPAGSAGIPDAPSPPHESR